MAATNCIARSNHHRNRSIRIIISMDKNSRTTIRANNNSNSNSSPHASSRNPQERTIKIARKRRRKHRQRPPLCPVTFQPVLRTSAMALERIIQTQKPPTSCRPQSMASKPSSVQTQTLRRLTRIQCANHRMNRTNAMLCPVTLDWISPAQMLLIRWWIIKRSWIINRNQWHWKRRALM